MQVLKLGVIDSGHKPADVQSYFNTIHSVMVPSLRRRKQFRDDGKWYDLRELGGNEVFRLQKFLHERGFLPHNLPTGVFDYVTLAGTRLFQEYIRTIEEIVAIGKPDGIVGPNTWKHVDRWEKDNLTCEWWPPATGEANLEHARWIRLMNTAKQYHLNNPHPVLEGINKLSNTGDTLKLNDWSFDPNEIHLIGVRRNEDVRMNKRTNDDIFLLLINGLVFKFWGSTDPSASLAGRSDEPFLVEGQHIYRFGWHKISNAEKIYKALKPATSGVMVFRDMDNDNKLTERDVQKGLQGPNNSINIHWSGIGSFNFSAGCQVISAKSYLNNRNQVVDCSAFASTSYSGLKKGQTRGAYNVLADLIFAYSPVGKHTLRFTLGRDDTLDLEPGIGAAYAEAVLKALV